MSRNSKFRSLSTLTSGDLQHFQAGIQVEVTSDEGNLGSWDSGKIIKRVDSSRFSVRYRNIFEDEDGKKLLEEIIDAENLRPVARRENVRKFQLGETVDAFYLDGWWEGKISEELGNGRFFLYFKTSSELTEFGEEQLRLHRDWIDGSWIPPLEKDNINKTTLCDKLNHGHKFEKGMRVEVSCDDEDGLEGAWLTAKIVDSRWNSYMVQYDSLKTQDGKEGRWGILHPRITHLS